MTSFSMLLVSLYLFLMVWSIPILERNLDDVVLSRTQPFEFLLPDDTFNSSNGGLVRYSVRSEPEGLIKGTLAPPISVVKREKSAQPLLVYSYEGYAYLGERRGGVRIVNVTDPSQPTFLSYVPNEDCEGMYVNGNYLYFGAEDEFVIVNVTDKTNPEVLSTLDLGVSVKSWGKIMTKTDEEILYFCNSRAGLRIANVSDKSNPFVISSITTGMDCCRDLKVSVKGSSTFAYVGDSGEPGGFRVYNVTNETTPQFMYSIDAPGKIYRVTLSKDENYLFFHSNSKFRVFDISDPTQIPFEAASLPFLTLYYTSWIQVSDDGNFVYAGINSPTRGYSVVNVTIPTDPKEIKVVELGSSVVPFDGHLSNGHLFVATESPNLMYAYDVKSDRLNPSEVSELNLGGSPLYRSADVQAIVVHGDVLFVADNNPKVRGIRAQWIRDRANPHNITSHVSLPCTQINSMHLDEKGEYMIASNYFCGLMIIDVRDIFDLKLVGNITFSSEFLMDIQIKGDIVYGAVHTKGLRIYDVSDRTNPVSISLLALPPGSGARGVFVTDEKMLYISDNYDDKLLHIVNVSDPYHPVLLSFLEDDDAELNYELSVSGDYAYIPNYGSSTLFPGFYIVNISVPTHPEVVFKNFYGKSYGYKMDVIEEPTFSYAYFTDRIYGLGIYDVSNKKGPLRIGSSGSTGYCYESVVEDNFAYTADGVYGYSIIRGALRMFETKKSFEEEFVCGNVTVVVEATDSTEGGPVNETFVIHRNSTCSNRGTCLNNKCNCTGGYIGEECEEWNCEGISRHVYQVCKGHGTCVEPNKCQCSGTGVYSGNDCQYWTCFGTGADLIYEVCGGHGTCIDRDKCYCSIGYGSSQSEIYWECDLWYCNSRLMNDKDVCSSRGKCNDFNKCFCENDYEGDDCETWSCFGLDYKLTSLTCSGNGKCVSPAKCVCHSGYDGKNCETNTRYVTVMAPVLSVSGFIFFLGLLCLVCLICCCCCLGFMILMMTLLVLSCIVFRQRSTVKKFSQLKNFDLLLKEQEMDEDTSVAHLKINKGLYEIPFDEISVDKILGEGGSQSVVFKAFWKNKTVAFKCFKTRHLCGDQESYDEFEKEVEILASISHPHIVIFYGATMNPPRVGIIMEYCEHSDLGMFITSFRERYGLRYPIKEKFRMLFEIVMAFEYLHSRNIIHRDLKLENILVNSQFACKLMDFGLSKIVDRMSQQKTKKIGTNIYMAPEICTGEDDYNEKCDVFSFGILVWVLLTENVMPYGKNANLVEMKVASNPDYRPDLNALDEILISEDDESKRGWVKQVCSTCWDHEMKKRWGFKRLSDLFQEKTNVFSRSKFQKKKSEEKDDGLFDEKMGKNWVKVGKYVKLKEEKEELEKEVEELKRICEENGIDV